MKQSTENKQRPNAGFDHTQQGESFFGMQAKHAATKSEETTENSGEQSLTEQETEQVQSAEKLSFFGGSIFFAPTVQTQSVDDGESNESEDVSELEYSESPELNQSGSSDFGNSDVNVPQGIPVVNGSAATNGQAVQLSAELEQTEDEVQLEEETQTSQENAPEGTSNAEGAGSEVNSSAPTGDPFFKPIDRDGERTPEQFKQESRRGLEDQVVKETDKAGSEVPVKANIKEGEPTILEPKSEPENAEPIGELKEINEEQGEAPENRAVVQQSSAEPPKGEIKRDNNRDEKVKEGKPLMEGMRLESMPELPVDDGVATIRAMGDQQPSSAAIAENASDPRSEEEKIAEQQALLDQFNQTKETTVQNIQQKIDTDLARVQQHQEVTSALIAQQAAQQIAKISAAIGEQRQTLEQGYEQTRQTLQVNKEAEFVRLEAVRTDKIAMLNTEMEARRTSFNAFVDEQTNMPTVNATNEANRADAELEAAAQQAIAEGETVAGRHPKSGDGHPEARSSVRRIARESAQDMRNSTATIRQDLLSTAANFNGGFERYRTDISQQITNSTQELTGSINEGIENFRSVIDNAYQSVITSLATKEEQELQQLNQLEQTQIASVEESKQTGLQLVAEASGRTIQEIQDKGRYGIEMATQLGQSINNVLTPGDGTPILSAVREVQQGSVAQMLSIGQDAIAQLDAITNQGIQAFDRVVQSNLQSNSEIGNKTTQQARQLVATSAQQRQQSLSDLAVKMDESFGSLQASMDQLRTEALMGIDEAIEERKGKILEANAQFLTELIAQNDENIATAKQPLTDPLFSRLWSAADRETASWWEGAIAAIGDFIVMLIIIIAVAAILVAAGVFSSITGALLVIGAVLLAGMFIWALASRIWNGNGWMSLPLAISDTLGITMIYQGITNRDIASGDDLGMNTFDRWYSGTSGTLQFVTILLAVKSKIPILRGLRMPRVLTEGPVGRALNRGVEWVEGVGRNTRARRNGGNTPEELPIGDRFINWVRGLFNRRNAEEPIPDENQGDRTNESEGNNRRSNKEEYVRELATQKAQAEAQAEAVQRKVTEVQETINRRNQANDAQGDFGDVLQKTQEQLTLKQQELARIRQEIANAESQNRVGRLRERLRELEGEVDALRTQVTGSHGMRRETADALETMEKLKHDPLGDVNSEAGKNHYNASRIEARNEPLMKNGEVVLRPDGKPYSHIRDLQNAHDALVNVRRAIEFELNNPTESLTNRGADILFERLSEVNRLINRVHGFLSEIGWPPSRPHRWVEGPDGRWVGEGDVAVLRPRMQTKIEAEVSRADATQRSISRLRNRETMTELMGRRRGLLDRLQELETQLEAATTETQVRNVEGLLNRVGEDIRQLEFDIFQAQFGN